MSLAPNPSVLSTPRTDGAVTVASVRGWAGVAGVTVALLFAAFVYYPITQNFFFEDDFFHLYQIANQPQLQFLFNNHAGHLYLTRNAIFLAFWNLFGVDERFYYWASFLTHLVNVGALFVVTRLLTGSVVLACFGATLWGISPLGEGAVGWYSVYGQVVSGLPILAILYGVAGRAHQGEAPGRRQRIVWYALALVAATSFGTGLGVAMALPFALGVVFHGRSVWRVVRSVLRLPLLSLIVTIPALYIAVDQLWMMVSGQVRGTSMFDAVVGFGDSVLSALGHLLAYPTMQLLAGPLYPAAAYPDPLATVVALLCLAAAIPVLLSGGGIARRLPVALAILVVANYGSIALGRWILFGALGGSFAAAARYHYAGSMLLTLLLCTVLARWAEWISWPTRWSGVLLVLWLSITATVYAVQGPKIDNHIAERRETAEALAGIRAEIARRPPGAEVDIYNRPFRSITFGGPAEFPGWAGIFVLYYPDNVVDGHRVRFLTVYSGVLEAAPLGRRSAELFIDARQATTEE